MIILASASPRRRELLKLIVEDFKVYIPNIDEEEIRKSISPSDYVEATALKKAEAILELNADNTVIGADTIVVYKNEILGKPKDYDTAFQMLSTLSGQLHQVYTGVAVVTGSKKEVFYQVTDVEFDRLSSGEIDDYIHTGESMDKAGAYGIQGYGARFVKQIRGDYFNVVGLPLNRLYKLLKKLSII